MAVFDVFNGDADGICALHQLRLAEPMESTLVTGVKRNIILLDGLEAGEGDQINVMDISLDKNRSSLERLLEKGAEITYFDHHFAGEIPEHHRLKTYIDTSSDTCTSLLVNDYLNSEYLAWAVTATFGDNLFKSAMKAAEPLNLSSEQLEALKALGTYINYNGYGAALEDLHFEPKDLYAAMKPFDDPFEFINEASEYQTLAEGYTEDIESVSAIKPEQEDSAFAIYILPDEPWSRRVSGVFANQLAQDHPSRAHAILSIKENGSYLVSVRAPLNNRTGADEVCRKFPSGGGRKAAAGINELPTSEYINFISVMTDTYGTDT